MARPRLAWFSPLPPIRSGIAAYSAELLPRLAIDYDIVAFVRSRAERSASVGVPVLDAFDFQWRHLRRPYDLVVYQIGNSAWHDYAWPYLVRYPGLAVLHDARLHQARAANLLQHGRRQHYRDEFAWCHPAARPGIAEFAVAGFGGPLYYLWPMLRIPIAAARCVAVHNRRLRDDLAGEFPDTPVEAITLGVADPLADPERGLAVRDRHRLPRASIVITAFGLVTPEKRIEQILRALSPLVRSGRDCRLVLVGDEAEHAETGAIVRASDVADRVVSTGFVPDADLGGYLAAADLCCCLRWPSSRETSASWLRCLAAARPTVITDLADSVDVPTLDPRTWTLSWAPDAETATAPDPVAVSIDILDEDHSLGLALSRLVADEPLRRALGTAARARWRRCHTIDAMAADYRRAIEASLGAPGRGERELRSRLSAELPAHLVDDGTGRARGLLTGVGLALDWRRTGLPGHGPAPS